METRKKQFQLDEQLTVQHVAPFQRRYPRVAAAIVARIKTGYLSQK